MYLYLLSLLTQSPGLHVDLVGNVQVGGVHVGGVVLETKLVG